MKMWFAQVVNQMYYYEIKYKVDVKSYLLVDVIVFEVIWENNIY